MTKKKKWKNKATHVDVERKENLDNIWFEIVITHQAPSQHIAHVDVYIQYIQTIYPRACTVQAFESTNFRFCCGFFFSRSLLSALFCLVVVVGSTKNVWSTEIWMLVSK